jgi:putative thioredoxin
MTLPPNFGQAVDLSSLGKPAPQVPAVLAGISVTAKNLTAEFLDYSATKPAIILCWSPRSPESMATLEILGELESENNGTWRLGNVNIDEQPQVAQALQTKTVPYAVAFVAAQLVPLFEQPYAKEQIALVINKVLELSAQQGVGAPPPEVIEPEEEEALKALETGDFTTAQAAYKKLLARKPQDTFAKLGLAQTELFIRTQGLNLESVKSAAQSDPLNALAAMACADMEIINGDVQAAFDRLLHCVRNLTDEDKKSTKDHLLALFALVDPADPRLIKARSDLANALF